MRGGMSKNVFHEYPDIDKNDVKALKPLSYEFLVRLDKEHLRMCFASTESDSTLLPALADKFLGKDLHLFLHCESLKF